MLQAGARKVHTVRSISIGHSVLKIQILQQQTVFLLKMVTVLHHTGVVRAMTTAAIQVPNVKAMDIASLVAYMVSIMILYNG